ncbi:MAG: exodeoxyribonuclease VII large subunit, partial [Nocardioidaceae bacterium]
HDELGHHLARVRGLSPRSTLARGYAVAQRADGTVISRVGQVDPDDEVSVRIVDGHLRLRLTSVIPTDEGEPA